MPYPYVRCWAVALNPKAGPLKWGRLALVGAPRFLGWDQEFAERFGRLVPQSLNLVFLRTSSAPAFYRSRLPASPACLPVSPAFLRPLSCSVRCLLAWLLRRLCLPGLSSRCSACAAETPKKKSPGLQHSNERSSRRLSQTPQISLRLSEENVRVLQQQS